eukprot:m.160767 g.160767  ORF g.160767 m.160767 type:complete len:339 (-) comp11990_c0_seq1:270-1286(-)
MLVESRRGKSGCSFEVVLEQPEAEFVMVTHDGKLVGPKTVPKRLTVPKSSPSPTDVVKKTQDAEARRASEVNKVRYAAHKHNVKVVKTVIGVQQQYANLYWQLDSKLRAADRRREDIVAQIRAKAQEHSVRVQQVSKTNVVKSKTLDGAINECLVRAAENRNRVLRATRERIASQNSKVENTRRAQAAGATKAQMEMYWALDRKLQQAERRRQNKLDGIREKAASPTGKYVVIRQSAERDAEQKLDKLAARLNVAAARKQEMVDEVKAKAHQHVQKVEDVHMEKVRRVSDLDITTNLRLLRAEEKRAEQLQAVIRNQKRRSLKAERVRQTKRMIEAQL